jgi:hypothetical protein
MEAIGHQTKHIIDSLNDAGHQIKSIFMSGGQCKNKLLIQTISKCSPLPDRVELKSVVLLYRLLYRITLKRLSVWAQRFLESKLLLNII